VQLVQEQLATAVASGGSLDQLIAAAAGAYALAGCVVPPTGATPVAGVLPPSSLTAGTTCYLVSSVAYGLGLPAGVLSSTDLGGLKAQTGRASTVLASVFAGVDSSILPGIAAVKKGLSNPACDPTDPTDPSNPCGIAQVQQLVSDGIGQLVDAVSAELAGALTQASTGADALADGTGLLAAGSAQLADGADQAADGAAQVDGGLGQIADGAGDLAAGLGTAADGSVRLADGLMLARAGDQKVVAGAGRLRTEGTSKLVAGGNDTAAENAAKAATLVAMTHRVATDALPYGAPEGASGSAAYRLTLAGQDKTSQDNRNRALAAGLLLLAACGVGTVLRRRSTTA
jgi:putative membrane protein